MPAGSHNHQNAVKCLVRSLWITFTFIRVHGQKGNGCGHTKLGTESGTLASPNYPGTYPADVWCRWRLRVPQGRTLRLLFGDFDIEESVNCSNGSLVITPSNGSPAIGPLCGKLTTLEMNVSISSNETTVDFRSYQHRSELISCQKRGSHFSSDQFSVYCPAGCTDVFGEVTGNSEQGYRDTSVLCKSAVHGGVVSDNLGGHVTVTRGRSLKSYEATFANGVMSKSGSLTEHKLLFSHECNSNLTVSLVNASSFWERASGRGESASRRPGRVKAASPSETWTADGDDQNPWVELDLGDKRTVTGLITTGSLKSFTLHFSKDGNNWKAYKAAPSRERKVFEAHFNGYVRVMNSLFPPMVARFVQLKPVTWHRRPSAQVQLLGCPLVRLTRTYSAPGSVPPVVVVVVGVVLGLVMCVSCLLAGFWWKRRKKDPHMKKYSIAKGPVGSQSLQGKGLGGELELISYPLETLTPLQRNVHDTLPSPPLNDYAEPAAGGQTLGSTFRPSQATPCSLDHYRVPANLPEYAQPLPPEPEYATPFSEQLPEGRDPARPPRATGQYGKHGAAGPLPPPPPPPPAACGGSSPGHTHYDCPSHRVLSNGYCTPSSLRPVYSELRPFYSELQSSDSLLQERHTYEELL
ncbi:hypothetical protein NHX12_001582 [Muraenolepis orangiensis]|uniref:Discoidin, CUB and LCCL domain-containing protein 1-like n=1 Tax=Muraenolepis orangiensis TaxID=630683 RepID=A0A9Q0E2S6_9TELE|nr:hypothetical protein NHX12_001582 [Muraenolepis orangiensis]